MYVCGSLLLVACTPDSFVTRLRHTLQVCVRPSESAAVAADSGKHFKQKVENAIRAKSPEAATCRMDDRDRGSGIRLGERMIMMFFPKARTSMRFAVCNYLFKGGSIDFRFPEKRMVTSSRTCHNRVSIFFAVFVVPPASLAKKGVAHGLMAATLTFFGAAPGGILQFGPFSVSWLRSLGRRAAAVPVFGFVLVGGLRPLQT
jgi:hypothetical protein